VRRALVAAGVHANIRRCCFVQANAVKVAFARMSMRLLDQDPVYTVGLIDYPDELVVALLN
jgi:extracellular factor (EF) 3-hydroxypalmitic acid methyl ester biosynthesis protein